MTLNPMIIAPKQNFEHRYTENMINTVNTVIIMKFTAQNILN